MAHRSNGLGLLLSTVVLLTAICGCMTDTRHLTFTTIKHDGWKQTDTLIYTIASMGSVEKGGISLLLHTDGYEYENIALGITIKQDTSLLYQDQRNYLLEQNLPQRGIGRRCDYTLPIGNFTLCDTIPITITLTQRLDQPTLTGIHKIGVRIASPMREPGEPIWKVDWH